MTSEDACDLAQSICDTMHSTFHSKNMAGGGVNIVDVFCQHTDALYKINDSIKSVADAITDIHEYIKDRERSRRQSMELGPR